jgi:hypothetical protein
MAANPSLADLNSLFPNGKDELYSFVMVYLIMWMWSKQPYTINE